MTAESESRASVFWLLKVFGALYLTSLPVLLGLWFGFDFIPRRSHANQVPERRDFLDTFGNWDGVWYEGIVTKGYQYDPVRHSNVAFFPGYPMLARAVHWITGMSARNSLLAVTTVCLAGAFTVASCYARGAWPECVQYPEFVLLALGLWPMGLFLRMAYSEALFLLLLTSVLWGLQRQWPMWLLAVIAGAATGTRSVGVALLLPLLWDWWRRSSTWKGFAARLLVLGSVSCWGLFAYMLYLKLEFQEPLAFVLTQQHWAMLPTEPLSQRLTGLITLEPIWRLFAETNSAYWAQHEYVSNPMFSLQLWNPIYFLTCALLVGWGIWKRWLTPPEWLLSAGLLLIPYVLQSDRMMMLGHGRFTCVVFPMYLVLARLLHACPVPLTALVCSLAAVLLAFNSGLFAAWHRIF